MKTIVFCAGAPTPYLDILNTTTIDLLIGVDAGASRLVGAGFIPDLAIGDFDSQEPPTQCRNIIRLPCEKDDTDLEYALQHILQHEKPENIHKIMILGSVNGGRIDHVLANIWLSHQARFAPFLSKIHLIERNNSVCFFEAGSYQLQPENQKKYLSFIGLTPIKALTLQHVKYPLWQQDYPYPMALISNEFSGSQMSFSFSDGLMCVVQSAD